MKIGDKVKLRDNAFGVSGSAESTLAERFRDAVGTVKSVRPGTIPPGNIVSPRLRVEFAVKKTPRRSLTYLEGVERVRQDDFAYQTTQ